MGIMVNLSLPCSVSEHLPWFSHWANLGKLRRIFTYLIQGDGKCNWSWDSWLSHLYLQECCRIKNHFQAWKLLKSIDLYSSSYPSISVQVFCCVTSSCQNKTHYRQRTNGLFCDHSNEQKPGENKFGTHRPLNETEQRISPSINIHGTGTWNT